jgi:hypothetical protein
MERAQFSEISRIDINLFVHLRLATLENHAGACCSKIDEQSGRERGLPLVAVKGHDALGPAIGGERDFLDPHLGVFE